MYERQPLKEWYEVIAEKDAKIAALRVALSGLVPFATYQLSKMEEPRNLRPIRAALEAARKALNE